MITSGISVKCQISIPSINTLNWLLDRYSINISTVSQKSVECWPTRMYSLKITGSQLLSELSTECWSSVNWGVDRVYSIVKSIDQILTEGQGYQWKLDCGSLCSTGSKSSLITPSHLLGALPLIKPWNNFVSVRSKLNTKKVTRCSITECSLSSLFQCYLTRTHNLPSNVYHANRMSMNNYGTFFKIVTHKSPL